MWRSKLDLDVLGRLFGNPAKHAEQQGRALAAAHQALVHTIVNGPPSTVMLDRQALAYHSAVEGMGGKVRYLDFLAQLPQSDPRTGTIWASAKLCMAVSFARLSDDVHVRHSACQDLMGMLPVGNWLFDVPCTNCGTREAAVFVMEDLCPLCYGRRHVPGLADVLDSGAAKGAGSPI